ncbi:copper resistance CopC family protein [Agromyces salentinus]|uniref:CopC domain-containing protein n=1 Tax=Agromyces salentinus TaxID=269421 RepID=A0ABN2ML86_9MICO|nr:copper resistance CopC family protein [Agromyces salentinus]
MRAQRPARSGASGRRVRGILGAAAVVAASALLVSVPAISASAHNSVISTTPAEGEVVTQQPGQVSLVTNDDLLDLGTGAAMLVRGPDGLYYGDGCAVIDGASAAAAVDLGEPGTYTVTWQVVSTDGHPISGEWAFDWQPADGVALGTGTDAPACGGDAAPATEPDGGTAGDAGDEGGAETDAAASVPTDLLWLGGGVLVAVAAGVVTWLAVRRRA